MRKLARGVERILEEEFVVALLHLGDAGDQHLAAAEGSVGKLVSLEFEATAQSVQDELVELEEKNN